jgi:hypothetical protein
MLRRTATLATPFNVLNLCPKHLLLLGVTLALQRSTDHRLQRCPHVREPMLHHVPSQLPVEFLGDRHTMRIGHRVLGVPQIPAMCQTKIASSQ